MRLISFSTLCSPIWSKTRALKLSKHVVGNNEKTLLGGPPHFVLPRAPTSLNPPCIGDIESLKETAVEAFIEGVNVEGNVDKNEEER